MTGAWVAASFARGTATENRQKRGITVNRFNAARIALLVGVLALGFQAGPARAERAVAEAGTGITSAAATLVYSPVKIVYSLMGIIFGGVAYGLSGGDADVMRAVMTPAIRGDYVVTPAHIRRERKVEFFGREPRYREQVVLEEIY